MVEQRGQPLYSGQFSQKIREQALLVMVFFCSLRAHLADVAENIWQNTSGREYLADVEKKRALREQKTPSPEELVREFFERIDPSTKVCIKNEIALLYDSTFN